MRIDMTRIRNRRVHTALHPMDDKLLGVLDGGNPQRIVLGEVVAYLDRDREILRQFAALLQQSQRLEAPRSADDLEPLFLTFAHRTYDKVMQDTIGPDAGGKTLDGLAVDLPARVGGGWL
jgi:hypothetical protein